MEEQTTGVTEVTTEEITANGAQEPQAQQEEKPITTEMIDRLVQSRVDKATSDLGKTIAELKKENKTLKAASMTAEELQKQEQADFQKERAAFEMEKRQHFALKAVSNAGYSKRAENIASIVLGETNEATENNLKAFTEVVQEAVREEIEKKFKSMGRNPNGTNLPNGRDSQEESIAERLGKRQAEQMKKSNDILKSYLGG